MAIGNERGEALGFPFITFLAPGLIAMQIIQQAFSHTSSSIMIGKIQGNIVDILYAPMSLLAKLLWQQFWQHVLEVLLLHWFQLLYFSFIIDLEFYNFSIFLFLHF